MSIHQLVMFWRDTHTRCFTAWHFLPAPHERATARAYELWQAAQQLTRLQIYGAVLDTTPIRLATLETAPTDGMATRLQVSLWPTNPKQVGGGQLRFSIPGPTTALTRVVKTQEFTAWEWQLIEQELLPYMCSPTGVKVSVSPEHVRQAEIVTVAEERDPHPTEPFAAALLHTEEALTAAQHSYQQIQTTKVAARIAKYQTRLQLMQHWQACEQDCFEQATHLKPVEATAAPDIKLSQLQALTLKQTSEENVMTQLPPTPNISTVSLFLPLLPTDDAEWQDIPTEHFADPTQWLHRSQLREWLNLNERTYYRWVNEMKQYGLARSLPAQGNARVTLFYRPDIDLALSRAQLATASSGATRPPAPAVTPTVATALPQPDLFAAQLSAIVRELASLRQQQQTFTQAITRLETTLADTRQADLDQIQQQLGQLAAEQATFNAQLPQGQFLDLLAQLVNLNQLPTVLRQLNSNVQKLSQPKKKKVSPVTTTKAKKKKSVPKVKKKKSAPSTLKKKKRAGK
jgi:hypothetical protein